MAVAAGELVGGAEAEAACPSPRSTAGGAVASLTTVHPPTTERSRSVGTDCLGTPGTSVGPVLRGRQRQPRYQAADTLTRRAVEEDDLVDEAETARSPSVAAVTRR